MKTFLDYIIITICLLIIAISFNLFFYSSEMIISGVNGFAIIIGYIWEIEAYLIILVCHLLALLIGYFFLNKIIVKKALYCLLLYPFLVYLTSFSKEYASLVKSEDFLVFIIFGALIMGIASGIIYKKGFTYGGGGLLIRIINKYYGKTIGQAGFLFNGSVVILGGFILGIEKVFFAILIIYISTYLQDRILLGDYANKLVFINTTKITEINNYLKSINLKGTHLQSTGCFSGVDSEFLMCYLANQHYFLLKEGIMAIDPQAFVFVTNAYSYDNGDL